MDPCLPDIPAISATKAYLDAVYRAGRGGGYFGLSQAQISCVQADQYPRQATMRLLMMKPYLAAQCGKAHAHHWVRAHPLA